MNNELRIVFMGTPPFAVHCLEEMLKAGHHIAGVVTAPDKPAGRGRKLQESAVKQFARQNNLKILQPTNLKSEKFLEDLRELRPDVQVVVAFRMLPKVVWNLPPEGTFNLHASLLPQYRGAAPINWAIMNGEKKTGVSTFFLDEKIDTGEMILQKEVKISEEETAGELHDLLMHTGAQLILKTLNLFEENRVETKPQPQNFALKEAPKLTRENTKIDWNKNLKEIHNHIRGLNPYPAAWCYYKSGEEQVKVKIFDCRKDKNNHNYEHGRILQEEKTLKVAVKDGFLIIDEIQLPGKRRMKTKELLNGYEFSAHSKFL